MTALHRLLSIPALVLALLAGCAAPPPATAPKRVLFIGNSFTYAHGSIVKDYAPGSVTDLNGTGMSGIPALFKALCDETGIVVDVSLEAIGGVGLDRHWNERLPLLDKPWDQVVMHGYSTLDQQRPGNPGLLVDYTKRFADALTARNPQVDLRLMATWSRADQTYEPKGAWYGKPIVAMFEDVSSGYDLALVGAPRVRGIIPVGLAWNLAIERGFADPDPYDGLTPGEVDLWGPDHYHASKHGSYLEALTVWGALTGRDPRTLGESEKVAADLGIEPSQVIAMENLAQAALQAAPPLRR